MNKGKTAEQFAAEYAARAGVTVEWLREHGREVRPCDCDSDLCEGWQMAHVAEDDLLESELKQNT